jgi:exopolysaccharide biosynthesis polyprenyl glycosylphosphotransferase
LGGRALERAAATPARTAAPRREQQTGAHSSVVRVIFYSVGLAMIAVEVVALAQMPWLAQALGSDFAGWSRHTGPWLSVLGDPLAKLWCVGSVALAGGTVAALWAVRRAKADDADQVETTELNATGWRAVYQQRLVITDLVTVLWSMVGAEVLWLGPGGSKLGLLGDRAVSYGFVGLLIATGWTLTLQVVGARAPLVYGEGTAEYGRVLSGSVFCFGILAIVAVLVKADFARGYVLISFPLGTLSLLVGRWVWRQWLSIKRRQGLYSVRSVVIGDADAVKTVVRELSRRDVSGYRVEAIGLDDPDDADDELSGIGVPIVAMRDTIAAMRGTLSDSVIVAGGNGVSDEFLRSLSWEMEPNDSLILTPVLLDVAGPRIATRPVAGLNLVHVETPRFSGPKAATKRTMDVLGSAFGLVVLLVPFAVIGLAIRATSKGPVFYRHERIGHAGQPFRVWKFRSMVVDADKLEAELHAMQDAGNEVQFKLKDDPRVTRIGRWMRRTSVDELPQLINVLTGSMSLVGPRPHVQAEVDQYTDDQRVRRLMVRPGITGLWQVSGRSDLSWDESIRLDLYYVENWSVFGDLQLLFRTVRAVLRGKGAY